MYSVNLNVRVNNDMQASSVLGHLFPATLECISDGYDVSLSAGEVEDIEDEDKNEVSQNSPTLQYSINRAFEIARIDSETRTKLMNELKEFHVGFKHLEY